MFLFDNFLAAMISGVVIAFGLAKRPIIGAAASGFALAGGLLLLVNSAIVPSVLFFLREVIAGRAELGMPVPMWWRAMENGIETISAFLYVFSLICLAAAIFAPRPAVTPR